MVFTTLGLMLGSGCNIKCRSCLWGDLLNKGPKMSVKDACGWIDQAHSLGNLLLVGFSGGEPFLYMNEMKEIAQYAQKKYNLPFVAATNSFWASSIERAEVVLGSLFELGLRQLLVSVDEFHQEYVPLNNVKNCLTAAKSLGIHCTIQCVNTLSSKKLSYYMDALGVSKGKDLAASEISCTPVGSAACQIPKEDFPTYSEVPADYCTLLQAMVVRPDGTVNLCCGPAFSVEALSAGNLHQETLESIVERAEWNPLFNALALGNGPRLIAELLKEKGEGKLLREKYTSSCHACHHILSQPNVASILENLLEPQRAELFLKRAILDQETGDRTSEILKL
jgi:hypothetical protein